MGGFQVPDEAKTRMCATTAIQRDAGAKRRSRQWESCVAATISVGVGVASSGQVAFGGGSPNVALS